MKKTLNYAAKLAIAVGLFAAGYSSSTIGQHQTNSNTHSAPSHANSSDVPIEGGQGAFAALAEVVAILEVDKNTDWSKVNITSLRNHLVDMNSLTLQANVTVSKIANGVEFTITGDNKTLRAIQSMVPAHANELNKMAAWTAETEILDNGVRLSMTSKDLRVVQKINALGFFGLMATGSHHQPHHLGMAQGIMVH